MAAAAGGELWDWARAVRISLMSRDTAKNGLTAFMFQLLSFHDLTAQYEAVT